MYRLSNIRSKTYEHTIEYSEGIAIGHVLASASVPISYDYTIIQDANKSKRKFWDGIILRIPAGKNPIGLAAVSLYIACRMTGEYKTQVGISKVAGVTEVTLRNRFKDLKDKLELYFVW